MANSRRLILTAGSNAFRVHLGVLLPRISIRQLLRFAQRDLVFEAAYKGSVALRLEDDAEDLRHYLLAVYHDGYFSYPYSPSRRQIWFEKVAGVLRIAHKYEDRELRQRALLILSEAFCTTPDGSLSVCVRKSYLIEDRDLEGACVLAHEVGAFWLLPNIYFRAIVARARFEKVGPRGLQKWSAADLKEDMIASLMYKLTWRLPRQCMNHHDRCVDDHAWCMDVRDRFADNHDRCTRSLCLYRAEYQLDGLFAAAIAVSRQDSVFGLQFAVCDRCTIHIMGIFDSWAEEQCNEAPFQRLRCQSVT